MSLRVTKIRPSRNRMKKREIPLESKKSQDRDKPFTTSYSRSNSKSKSLDSELMAETEEMNEALEELLEANRELKKEVKDLKGINNLKKTLSDKERERIISHGEKLMRRQEENNKNDRRKYEKTKQKLKEKEQQIRGILLATTYANTTKTYRDHNSFEMMRIEKENQDLNIIVEDLRRDLKAALSILEKEREQSRLDFGKCAAIIEKLRQEKQQLENDNNNLRLQLES